jgi:DNA-binding CsgD family transcriptional regulator/PAS domain-containing protein
MPLEDPELLRLIASAYEAAADPALWTQFLARWVEASGADLAFLQRHHLTEHRSELVATYGMQPRLSDSYNRYYSRVNVWREHGRHLYVEGAVLVDEQFYPRDLLKRSEFYNDCLLPNGATRCMTGVISRRQDHALVLTAMRGEQRQPFDTGNSKAIGQLVAHLARAFTLQERLQMLEAGEAVLNTLGLGIVLLAGDGHVVFSNRAAEEILRAEDGLLARRGQLVASSHHERDDELQNLIRYAIGHDRPNACPPGVLVTRPSGRAPLHVTASPLKRTPTPFVHTTSPVAVVLITDPGRHRPVAAESLKQTYGLTAREAALATALAGGRSLDAAAEQLQMRYETARTHLRRILSKTETSRQTELVLLLQRMSQ